MYTALTKIPELHILPTELFINESRTLYYALSDGRVYCKVALPQARWRQSVVEPYMIPDMVRSGLIIRIALEAV
jgi:hypothetical protein